MWKKWSAMKTFRMYCIWVLWTHYNKSNDGSYTSYYFVDVSSRWLFCADVSCWESPYLRHLLWNLWRVFIYIVGICIISGLWGHALCSHNTKHLKIILNMFLVWVGFRGRVKRYNTFFFFFYSIKYITVMEKYVSLFLFVCVINVWGYINYAEKLFSTMNIQTYILL